MRQVGLRYEAESKYDDNLNYNTPAGHYYNGTTKLLFCQANFCGFLIVFYDFLQVPSQAETKAEGKKAGGLLLCTAKSAGCAICFFQRTIVFYSESELDESGSGK